MKARSSKPKAKTKGKAKARAKPKRIGKLRTKAVKKPVKESASEPSSNSQRILEGNRIDRLFQAISNLRKGVGASPRTTKLLSSGSAKMAQRVIEEAAELGIEAVRGDRAAFVNENADLFFNVVALWTELGVVPRGEKMARIGTALCCAFSALLSSSFYAPAAAQVIPDDRKIIIFVWDGLRPDSVTAKDTPNLYAMREAGVNFTGNHSTYPTFTMMNAASFATGSFSGTTGYYGNTLWQPGASGDDSAGKAFDFQQPVFTED